MNLICTAHWRLKLLVGSHLSHTQTLPRSLSYSARCLMWFVQFIFEELSVERYDHDERPSPVASEGHHHANPSRCHSEGPE